MVEEEEVFGISCDGRPALSERMSSRLFHAVHQAVGDASMCWDNIDGAGTFEAMRAGKIAFELCHLIADEIEVERDGACGYVESTITRRDAYIDRGRQHLKRARILMSTYPEV
jgi:flavin-dependent dehydrogenase